jgi:hypothetical protein
MNNQAPILLMTYRRVVSTLTILKLLKKFNQKKIYIFQDGLKKDDHKVEYFATKKIIKKFIKSNKNIKFKFISPKNNLSQKFNLPYALNTVFRKNESAIILEDDCIPSKDFFRFCNLLLLKYKNDNRISQISGNNFLNFKKFKRRNNDSYFFSKFTTSWGWATWKSRWNCYDSEIKIWPRVKMEKWLNDILPNKKSVEFWTKAFSRRYNHLDDDWDRAWTFVNFVNNRLNIFPNKNLISNIGYDNFALHSNPKKWNNLKIETIKFPLIHPSIICYDRKVDCFLTDEGFSTPKLSFRIKNRFKFF